MERYTTSGRQGTIPDFANALGEGSLMAVMMMEQSVRGFVERLGMDNVPSFGEGHGCYGSFKN